MLVGKNHNFVLKTISEWNIKHVISIAFVWSLLINIGHCFQYRINYGWGQLLDSFDQGELPYDLYPSIVVYNSFFQVYSIVYFFLNFIVFFLINTVVEASLVLQMRKEIAEKRERIEEEIRLSTANNLSGSDVVNKVILSKQKKITEDAKKETRAINMVITNSLFNFFLRLPEILVFFSSNAPFLVNLVYYQNYSKSTFTVLSFLLDNISTTLVNISYFCYILTFNTNVAINCAFNQNFKQHFVSWN
jgi:hypothetical protein